MAIQTIKYIFWLLPILGLTQALLQNPGDDFPFSTVIDILSENVEFSTFLRIIQKTGHVQYLNELQNFTLFAPINSAFIKGDQTTDQFEEHFHIEDFLIHDRVLQVRDLENGTYLEKRAAKAPLLLRKHERHCFVNEIAVVEPDLLPSFQNASLQGINNLLLIQPQINELLVQLDEETQDLKIFSDFISSFSNYNAYTNSSTVLVPLDVNFRKFFNTIEINYLLDKYNKLGKSNTISQAKWAADRTSLLQELIIDDVYGGILPKELILENKNSRKLFMKSNSEGTSVSVNNSDYSPISNRIFEIGVVHGFSDLDFLRTHIQFDAEKYLHGLNCSEFVKELYFRDLEKFIQNGRKITIFVPQASFNEDRGYTKPSLLYHFVEGKIDLAQDFSHCARFNTHLPKFMTPPFALQLKD
ncbi:BFH_collapsed_G0035460.mRNA.1.CDS.1 [Saccharomyces cerevisiae]|nr:BFH_collapsed_G0035460.mRNA.1.CDS.1 [Saccharomyces cerevisiae]